jgi:hypothetical protein
MSFDRFSPVILHAYRLREEDEDRSSDSGKTGGMGSTAGGGSQCWASEAPTRLSSEDTSDSRAKIVLLDRSVFGLQGA